MPSSTHRPTLEKAFNNPNNHHIMKKVFSNYVGKGLDPDKYHDISINSLMKCVRKYDPTRGNAFTSYLYKITTCACIDELRKNRNKNNKTNEPLKNNIVLEPSRETTMVRDGLMSLNGTLRKVIEMKYFYDMSINEISLSLGLLKEEVVTLIDKAETALRGQLC